MFPESKTNLDEPAPSPPGEVPEPFILATAEGALLEYQPDSPERRGEGDAAGGRLERRRSIRGTIGAMIPGSVASMNIGLQPVLFGALVEAKRITPSQLGLVATFEIFALALGSFMVPRLLRHGHVRAITIALAFSLATVDIATYWAASLPAIYILKTLAGLLAGGLSGVTIFLVTHSDRPDRMTSAFQAISTVPQMVGSYVLAVLLNPLFGPYSGFGLMAALALAAGLFALAAPQPQARPRHLTEINEGVVAVRTIGVALALTFLAILTENAAIGAVWEYLAQVAHLAHMSNQVAGGAVAGLLGFQLLGAMTAAWIGWKLDNRTMLLACCAFLAVNAILIYTLNGAPAFLVATCIFGFVQIFLYPYGVKLLIELDGSRQAAMLLTPLTFIGTGVGPFICSWFVRPADISAAYWIALAVFLFTGALYAAVCLFSPRPLRWLASGPRPEQVGALVH